MVARRDPDLRAPARAPEIGPRAEPRITVGPPAARTEPVMSRANPVPPPRQSPAPAPAAPVAPAARPSRALDRERLEAALEELLAARHALDAAMKDGGS